MSALLVTDAYAALLADVTAMLDAAARAGGLTAADFDYLEGRRPLFTRLAVQIEPELVLHPVCVRALDALAAYVPPITPVLPDPTRPAAIREGNASPTLPAQ